MKKTIQIIFILFLFLFSPLAISNDEESDYYSQYDYPDTYADDDYYTNQYEEYSQEYYDDNPSVIEEAPEIAESHEDSPINTHYLARLPDSIRGYGEKVIIISPRLHVWGAYSHQGKLIRAGLASAGAKWCSDVRRACRTTVGSFRIFSLGNSNCVSSRYPLGEGGAPMPYCMYFNGGQGLHGSYQVAEANLSHGCVRMSIEDAKWIRFNFASIGTKVIVLSY